MMKKLALFLAITAALGCANGSDPLTALGDPSVTPALALPFTLTSATVTSQTEFTAATPYFEWTFGTAVPTAPAAGIVTAVDATASAASVTIYHNAHVTTQVSKLLSISVRVGDVLAAGQSLGGVTLTARFTVFLDGSAVCPLTYLGTESRTVVNANDGGADSCT